MKKTAGDFVVTEATTLTLTELKNEYEKNIRNYVTKIVAKDIELIDPFSGDALSSDKMDNIVFQPKPFTITKQETREVVVHKATKSSKKEQNLGDFIDVIES